MKTFALTNSMRRFVCLALSLLGCVILTVNVLGRCLSGSENAASSASGTELKPLRVLFVGNSYTYVNMLPEMVRQLSLAAKERRPTEYRMIAPGGYSLEQHWNDGTVTKAIAEGGWDYVVLQEQSVRPISDPANMHRFARLFDDEARKIGAKTVFYVTWARKTAPDQQKQLTRAYSAIAKELGGLCCPVGPAWANVLKGRPDVELYQSDGSHPSPAGSYIGACVFYAMLYGKSPVGLPGKVIARDDAARAITLVDLREADARLFQQTAAETVKEWKGGVTPAP